MTMASNGNPSYRLAKISRTMPVALLMIMAPNNGDQPCLIRSFTKGFRCVMRAHEKDDNMTSRTRMNGNGVFTRLMRAAETTPTRQSVTRSPRQAAIGGAMLSGFQLVSWRKVGDKR